MQVRTGLAAALRPDARCPLGGCWRQGCSATRGHSTSAVPLLRRGLATAQGHCCSASLQAGAHLLVVGHQAPEVHEALVWPLPEAAAGALRGLGPQGLLELLHLELQELLLLIELLLLLLVLLQLLLQGLLRHEGHQGLLGQLHERL
jgi:hypothetical protein